MMLFFQKPAKSKGFTLVEILVALAIGSLVMLALVTFFSQSIRQSAQLEARSYIAEAGRYSLDLLSQDLRQAGSWGCLGADFAEVHTNDGLDGFPESYWGHGVKVFNASSSGWSDLPEAVREVAVQEQSLLFISGARDSGIRLTGQDAGWLTGPAQVWDGFLGGLTDANALLVVDSQCQEGFTLGLTDLETSAGSVSLAVDLDEEDWPEWLGQTRGQDTEANLDRGSQVYRLESRLYFVGKHQGSRWLMRWQSGAGKVEPLVEGVEQMLFFLGQKDEEKRLTSYIYEQDTAESPINSWSKSDWQQVGALRLSILIAAPQETAGTRQTQVFFRPGAEGVTITGREAGSYSITTALRGRMSP